MHRSVASVSSPAIGITLHYSLLEECFGMLDV